MSAAVLFRLLAGRLRPRLTADEQASDVLAKLATRAGPISDELTSIARRFKSGDLSAAAAARDFLGVVRRAGEGGLDAGSDAGRPVAGAERERQPELAQETEEDRGPSLFQGREPAVVLRGDELGDPAAPGARDAAKAEFQRLRALGPVQNARLGEIKFSGQSQGKTFNEINPGKLALIPKLREIIQHGELVGSEPDYRGRSDVKAYHTLETRVRVGDQDALVHTVVREDARGRFYYDFRRSDEAPAAKTAPDGASSETSTLERAPSPGSLADPTLPKSLEQNRPDADRVNLSLSQGALGKIRLNSRWRLLRFAPPRRMLLSMCGRFASQGSTGKQIEACGAKREALSLPDDYGD